MPKPQKVKITLLTNCCVAGKKGKRGEVFEVEQKDANILVGLNRAVRGEIEVKKAEPVKEEESSEKEAPKKKVAAKKKVATKKATVKRKK